MTRTYSATIVWFLISYLTTFCQYSQCNGNISEAYQKTEWQAMNQRPLERFGSKAQTVFVEKRSIPFGARLGTASSNVPAYSNGRDASASGKSHKLYGVYMGMKWQCVEYARRWLFIRKGCIFADVDLADDMWHKLTVVKRVVDGKSFPLITHSNGSPTAPKNGSLVIYKRTPEVDTGHVAVIVDVAPGYIRVAEQNYDNKYWSHTYARQIKLEHKNGRYSINDSYSTYGWMEVRDNNQLKPLDQATINIISARNGASR